MTGIPNEQMTERACQVYTRTCRGPVIDALRNNTIRQFINLNWSTYVGVSSVRVADEGRVLRPAPTRLSNRRRALPSGIVRRLGNRCLEQTKDCLAPAPTRSASRLRRRIFARSCAMVAAKALRLRHWCSGGGGSSLAPAQRALRNAHRPPPRDQDYASTQAYHYGCPPLLDNSAA